MELTIINKIKELLFYRSFRKLELTIEVSSIRVLIAHYQKLDFIGENEIFDFKERLKGHSRNNRKRLKKVMKLYCEEFKTNLKEDIKTITKDLNLQRELLSIFYQYNL